METVQVADGQVVTVTVAPGRPSGNRRHVREDSWLPSRLPLGTAFRVRQGARVVLMARPPRSDAGLAVGGSGRPPRQPAAALAPRVLLATETPGTYWYRLLGTESELAGVVMVDPAHADYWNREATDRLVMLTEDLLAPRCGHGAELIADGRERLHIVNGTSAQVLDLRLPGAIVKVVGASGGRLDREYFGASIFLGPSDRVIVEALFPRPGSYSLMHRRPGRSIPLVRFRRPCLRSGLSGGFLTLRQNGDSAAFRSQLPGLGKREPDALIEIGRHGRIQCRSHPADDALIKVTFSNHSMGWAIAHATAGRFLQISRTGIVEHSLGWRDTLALRGGESADLLLLPASDSATEIRFARLESGLGTAVLRLGRDSGLTVTNG